MYTGKGSFQESDRKIGKTKDTRKPTDISRMIYKKKNQLKGEAMRSEDMNLPTFRAAIITLGDYHNPDHPNLTIYAHELGKYLGKMYDYKMRWLQEHDESEQYRREILTNWGDNKKKDFVPLYHNSHTRVTLEDALSAFDNACSYLQELEEHSGSIPLLNEALKRIIPFFKKTDKKVTAIALTPSPESVPIVESPEAQSPEKSPGVENPVTIQERKSEKVSPEEFPIVVINNDQVVIENYQRTQQQGRSEELLRPRRKSSEQAQKRIKKMFDKDGK